MSASYFDVDGTLVASNLIAPTFFYMVNQATPLKALVRVGRGVVKAPAMAVAELLDRRTFNELLYSTYQGMSEDRLLLLADEVVARCVVPRLFAGARDLLDRSRAAGHEIVLVSGVPDFILERVAEALGGATVIANRLEMKNGIATGKLLSPVVAGPEKARLIREHAQGRGFDLSGCYAFSDSYSDVPMLSVVGHPAAVNPDWRLKLLARAYAWPTIHLAPPVDAAG